MNLTYEDTFPTTNLEAMACGLPVIVYNTGGCKEAINNFTGFVVAKGDINSLVDKVNLIKNNTLSDYNKLSRDRVIEFFNKEDRFEEYIKLYENLI